MPRLIRWVLLSVIALFLVNLVVIGIGTSDTGPLEKVVLGAIGLALLLAAAKLPSAPARPPRAPG